MAEAVPSFPTPRGENGHRWVFDVLERAGAQLESGGDGVFTYRLSEDLVARWRRDRITFTFHKRLTGRDGVELATPGSWLHDQLVRLACGKGRLISGYLAARPGIDPREVISARRRGLVEIGERVERRYGRLLHFTFRVCVYSEPPEEQMITLAYDTVRGRVVRALARKAVLEALPTPVDGFTPDGDVDVRAVFREVWAALEDEVEDRVHALELQHHDRVGNGTHTVDTYYQQLIEEEKRLMKARSSRQGEDESKRRIQLLKLEWERRAKEESERQKPQAVAALSAVASLAIPVERWRCRVTERGGTIWRDLWVDLARGEAWEGAGEEPGSH